MKQKLRVGFRVQQLALLFCSAILAICVSASVIFLDWSTPNMALAGGTMKYTITSGEWSASIWSNSDTSGPTCSCNPGSNYNGPGIQIAHKLTSTVYNPLKISGGGVVNILASGSLEVFGNFELNGGSTINIVNSDTVIVNGDLTVSGASVINSGGSGVLKVNGNVTLSGGSKVVGPSGRLTASGTINGTGWQVATLPIELVNFHANPVADGVKLNWSTDTEKDNDYFTIERSSDGKNFIELLKHKGAGTSNVILNYSAVDVQPLQDITYYRLKQTDFDGHFSYSKLISSNNKKIGKDDEITLFSVSPNPFQNYIVFGFTMASKRGCSVKDIR